MKTLVAAVLSPLVLFRLPRKTWALLMVYLAACGALLWGFGSLLVAYERDLRHLILSYIFPESWHFAADFIIERFFASQQTLVLINAVIAGSLMVVTLLLFWLKEMVSASFEKDGKLADKPFEEHPLLEQAWQEIKLFLMFIAAQGTIFWIGYHPGQAWKTTALVLSYLFLFFTFALDFVSPIFQRHLGHYSRIIKTLLLHLPASLLFGAVFALPVIVVGVVWSHHPEWTWVRAIAIIFAVNVISVAWACVAGTWLGAKMLRTFDGTKRSRPASRVLSWVVLLGLLGANGYTFGSVALALHHKSQILRCEYDVVWTSFRFDRPGLTDLLKDKIEVGFHIDVDIKNPTAFDVAIEDNHLEIEHRGEKVATTKIDPLTVPAHQTKRQSIGFKVELAPSILKQGLDLIEKANWKMTLYVDVAPGFELPIYLLE